MSEALKTHTEDNGILIRAMEGRIAAVLIFTFVLMMALSGIGATTKRRGDTPHRNDGTRGAAFFSCDLAVLRSDIRHIFAYT